MDQIKVSDFFNFDDDQPISKLIENIEKLNGVFDTMVTESKKNADRYAASLNIVSKSVEELEGSLKGLDASSKKDQETLAKGAAQMEELTADNKEYSKSLKDTEETIRMLTNEQKKLETAKTKLTSINKAEAGSLADLKKQLKDSVKNYDELGDSVDDSVKQEALNNIKELSRTINEADKAVKTAKKGVDAAEGSYNALSSRVADAKKRLKDLEGGVGNNSKEFKKLQAEIKKDTDTLKEFDGALGDNQRSVGDYAGALDRVVPGLGGVASGLDDAKKASIAFISTPLGIFLLGVAAALGALTAFFRSSQEAEDKFNEITEVTGVILDNLVDILEVVGEALFNAITGPSDLWSKFTGILENIKSTFVGIFDDPIGALKELGNILVDNVIKRFEALGKLGPAIAKIFSKDFVQGFIDLGDAAVQATTGVEGVVSDLADSAADVFTAASDAVAGFLEKNNKEIEAARKIAAADAKFRRDIIAQIISQSETELKVAKLLQVVKDEIKSTDEEALAAQREANKLIEEQGRVNVQLARDEFNIAQARAALNGNTFDDNKELAELQAAVNAAETKFLKEKEGLLGDEKRLIELIARTRQEAAKQQADAEAALNRFLVADRIESNDRIIKDDKSTLDERLQAIRNNQVAEIQLAEEARDSQIKAATDAAVARVQLSQDTLDSIFRNTELTIDEQLRLEREAKEQLIQGDQAFIDTRTRIQGEYLDTIDDVNRKALDIAKENYFTQVEKDVSDLTSVISTQGDEQLLELSRQLEAGEINYREYGRARVQIEGQTLRDVLNSQLDALEEQLSLQESYGDSTIAVEEEIAAKRLELADITDAELIAKREAFNQEFQELGAQALATTLAGIEQQFAAEDEKLAARREKLEEDLAAELALAGDNSAAKAEVEEKFAEQERQLRNQEAAQARKKAVFDKATAAVNIAINTATGISKAVALSPITGGLPFSAIVAAIGAAQLALVLARPIPAFAEGTRYSPEGVALVGERGPELITYGGKSSLAVGPQLTYLKKGSEVLTADETRDFFYNHGLIDRDEAIQDSIRRPETNKSALVEFSRKVESLEETIRSKREFHVNITDKGVEKLIRDGHNWNKYLNELYG